MSFCKHEALEHEQVAENYLVSLHSSQNLVLFHLAKKLMLPHQNLSNSLKLQILHLHAPLSMLFSWILLLLLQPSYVKLVFFLLKVLHKQYRCLHNHLGCLWLWPLHMAIFFLHCNFLTTSIGLVIALSWSWVFDTGKWRYDLLATIGRNGWSAWDPTLDMPLSWNWVTHQWSLWHIVMSYPFYKQAITHGQSKSKKQEVKKKNDEWRSKVWRV